MSCSRLCASCQRQLSDATYFLGSSFLTNSSFNFEPQVRPYFCRLRGILVQWLRIWRGAEIGEAHPAVGCLAPPIYTTKILTVIHPPL